jgi:pyridoxal phosphate enzyme (YggS family)
VKLPTGRPKGYDRVTNNRIPGRALGLQHLRHATTLAGSVESGPPDLRSHLKRVREAIERAAGRARRDSAAIRLVAVVKTVSAERVREVVALGLEDLGENRVQEAERKIAVVGRGARWHMIGHLQRNKAARAVELFDRIHGVDNVELAAALSRHAALAGRTLPVLVEVNVTGEGSKFGVHPERLPELLDAIVELPGLRVDGLMTVGRLVERAEDARPTFARLRELRDRAATRLGRELPELSMGMSADYEVAVEEGATMVRVGTALFGTRTN